MDTQVLSAKRYTGSLHQRIIRVVKIRAAVPVAGIQSAFVHRHDAADETSLRSKARRLARLSGSTSSIWAYDNHDQRYPPVDRSADLTPDNTVTSRKSRVMQLEQYPEADYPFAFEHPPTSGNIINGLGESEKRRPGKVFHTGSYADAWGGMQRYFHTESDPESFGTVLKSRWDNRHLTGSVNPTQQPVENPADMSRVVKATASACGADAVGITLLRDEYIFENVSLPYRFAISIAVTMDRSEMLYTPSERSSRAIANGYRAVGHVAIKLAERIRAIGWEAKATTNLSESITEVLHVPIAIDAGLGQLGKHGSLITKDFGSNVRLATVLTNLPLQVDQQVDIGVDDFCASCQICVTNCPPHAIFDTKQIVRGEERWYVNFDRCVPYFSDNHGCGICIEVCPWSEAGRGLTIMEKMLAKRE